MKIGIVIPGFGADEADWCIPAQHCLVRELSRDHEVHVFAIRYPHRTGTYTVFDATVHAFGGALASGAERLPLLARVLAGVVGEARRAPFDVVHGMWADEPGFVAVVAGRTLRIPSVVSLLGGELVGLREIGYGSRLSLINRWLVTLSLRGSTRVAAGSAYLRRLARRHGVGDRLCALPIGVDTTQFYPAPSDHRPFVEGEIALLHVASLVAVKDQETLLRAVSQVVRERPGVHLHVVGDGPLRGHLDAVAASLGIERSVTFHGAVPYERMPAYYRAADLCVHASRHEGQELVTLEAGACARTIVGTAVGILPDLVPATRAVPAGDADALAQEVIKILDDDRTRAAMGQACRRTVTAMYSLEKTVADLDALYTRLSECSDNVTAHT